jgi:secreted trypsin-like serine protease
MLFSEDQWILVGITSYGTSCGLADHPGVYTRVSSYQNWISCFLFDNITCIDDLIQKNTFSFSSGATIVVKNIFFLFSLFCVTKTMYV